jgi:hypothetical protein
MGPQVGVAFPRHGRSKSQVIPAKAGVHSANLRKCAAYGLDSRLRGNDLRIERHPIPNNTSAGASWGQQLAGGYNPKSKI